MKSTVKVKVYATQHRGAASGSLDINASLLRAWASISCPHASRGGGTQLNVLSPTRIERAAAAACCAFASSDNWHPFELVSLSFGWLPSFCLNSSVGWAALSLGLCLPVP